MFIIYFLNLLGYNKPLSENIFNKCVHLQLLSGNPGIMTKRKNKKQEDIILF